MDESPLNLGEDLFFGIFSNPTIAGDCFTETFVNVVSNVLWIAIIVMIVAAILMTGFMGYRFVSSLGNEEMITNAFTGTKNILVGLVSAIVLALVIVLVMDTLVGNIDDVCASIPDSDNNVYLAQALS